MKLNDFLSEYGLIPKKDYIRTVAEFKLSEMKKALSGQPSSLEMISSYCSAASDIKHEKKVIVIDAGGTNLRIACVSFSKDGKITFDKFVKSKMPGLKSEITSDEFFAYFADAIEPMVNYSDTIGWCFSYSACILPDHDARILSLSKEIKAESVVGLKLGENLLAELKRRGHDVSSKKVMVFNDSVTTLLAGLSKVEELGCEGCIGFILGTGINSSYVENGVIINEESGALDIHGSETDLEFFNTTRDPNYHHLEKLVSGAYLGPLALKYIEKAVECSVFSEGFSKVLKLDSDLTTVSISDFLLNKPSPLDLCIQTQQDADDLTLLLKAHISRAAVFCAGNLAGTILKTGLGIKKPVLISTDGSTFTNVPDYGKQISQYLNALLAECGRQAVFVNVDNSSLIGAAIGALSGTAEG